MSEWEEICLKDIIKSANTGLDAIKRAPIVENDTGIKCLRIQDISQSKKIEEWGFCDVTEANYKKFRLRAGEIIMARTCSTGVHYLVPQDLAAVFNNGLVRIRADETKCLSKYLSYCFSTYEFKGYIKGISGGTSVQLNMQIGDLLDYPLLLPTVKEQHKVVSVLSSLDRKIENLRKQNDTLEAIAQSLFKHWFVDFEFPNEDGKPYKSSGGEMERSELGEIPAGWSIGTLGYFCNVKHGYAFKGEFITTDETDQILLTPGNFRIGGGFNSSKYKYYSDNNYDQEYILQSGDLIVTMTDLSKEGDTLGYPAFVPKNGNSVFLHNQRLGKVVDSKIDLFFLFFLLCRREYRSQILGTASGSTVRHTSPSRILEYKFTVPRRKLLDQFSLIVSKLIGKTFSNCEQISILDRTRDTLLPKLISGEIRIINHME
jgi:type I restriction enzyme S subunit